MANQQVTDAVNALLTEVAAIKTDFDAALQRIQSGNLSADEVVSELQPVSDALGAVDQAIQGAGTTPATTTTTPTT